MASTHRQLGLIVSRFAELEVWDNEERLEAVHTIIARTFEHRARTLLALSYDEAEQVIVELTSRVSERRQLAAQRAQGDPAIPDPLERLTEISDSSRITEEVAS